MGIVRDESLCIIQRLENGVNRYHGRYQCDPIQIYVPVKMAKRMLDFQRPGDQLGTIAGVMVMVLDIECVAYGHPRRK